MSIFKALCFSSYFHVKDKCQLDLMYLFGWYHAPALKMDEVGKGVKTNITFII